MLWPILAVLIWIAVLLGACLLVRGEAINKREQDILREWQAELDAARALRGWAKF